MTTGARPATDSSEVSNPARSAGRVDGAPSRATRSECAGRRAMIVSASRSANRSGDTGSGLRGKLRLDLDDARVGQRRAIAEEQCGNGLVPAVHLLHQRRGGLVGLDVDLGKADAFTFQLLLQPLAVAAPTGAEHGDLG